MQSLTDQLRRCRRLVAIASVAGALAVPAAASAHGYYNWGEPGATAPDGHYIVSISYTLPTVVDGWATGQLIGNFSCLWSDGTTDDCRGVADYF